MLFQTFKIHVLSRCNQLPMGCTNSLLAKVMSLALVVYSLSAGAATPDNIKSPLGINLNPISYWSSEQPFLNIFKTGERWIPQYEFYDPVTRIFTSTFDTGERNKIPLDANGYPTRLDGIGITKNPDGTVTETPVRYNMLGVLLQRQSSAPFYPPGQYVVLYDGEGELQYRFNAVKDTALSRPGRDVINVATPTSGGIWIRLTKTTIGNHVRNIRVVHASQVDAFLDPNNPQIFNPTFLDRVKSFHILRFMEWMMTNNSNQSSWVDRPTPGKAMNGDEKGVPLEDMAALSNKLKADPWFSMPHKATDDYITQFATLARNLLDPKLKVYVEYSNETWNTAFTQSAWAQSQGQALWGTGQVLLNYHGMRTAQICDIWKNVWGSEAGRVVCVMGAQAANPFTATTSLNCSLWINGPKPGPCNNLNHKIDAIAIAPYFSYGVPNTFTQDQLFTEIMQGGVLPAANGGYPGGMIERTRKWINDYKAVADQNGVELLAYEGGQHFANLSDQALTSLYNAANRDSRMGDAYLAYLQSWKAVGGHGFIHYNDAGEPTVFGAWGALENIMQTYPGDIMPLLPGVDINKPAHKFGALISFNKNNPCWWPGCEEYVPPDRAAPSVPTNLAGVVISVTESSLSWVASTDNIGVSGYKVYRNGTEIGTVTAGTTYQDTSYPGSNPGYASYTVAAFDAADNVSAQSDSIVLDNLAPSVPTGLVGAAISATQADLSWVVSTDNVGVVGYKVYSNGVAIGNTTSTTFQDVQFSGNANYSVAAFDAAGNESAKTAELSLSFDGEAPSAANLTGTAVSATQSNLSWTTSTDNVGVVGYDVYRGGDKIGETTTTSFSDPAFPGLATYLVKARDAAGNVTSSNSLTLDGIPPSVPTGLAGTAVSVTQADLSWTVSTDNVGVKEYKVYRNGIFLGAALTNAFQDAQFPGNASYSVTALDDAGNESVKTAELSLSFDSTPPSAPNLTGSAVSTTRADLSWSTSTDNVGVVGYDVYRGDAKIGDTTTTSFSDPAFPGLATYLVKARDAAGNDTSSNGVTLDGIAPSIPTNLLSTVVLPTQANLSWAASTDNVGVTGYKLYRNGIEIGSVTGAAYQDTSYPGVNPGNASYTVAAFDAAGNNSAQSVSISVVTPTPTVVVTRPTNGASFRNTDISISVTAADSLGISTITIRGDATTLRTCTNVTSCTATWSRRVLTTGTHTIRATATNRASKQSTSAPITINYRR